MKSLNNNEKNLIKNTYLYQRIKFKNYKILILGILLILISILFNFSSSVFNWFKIILLIILLFGFYDIYLFLIRNNDLFKHPDLKKFLRYNNPYKIIMLFETEISNPTKINPYSNCLILPNFLIKNSFFRFKVFYLHELVWIYSAIEKTSHSINFIPLGTSKEYSIKIYTDNGIDMEFKCSDKKEMNSLFDDLVFGAPFTIKGYDEDLENYWKTNKEDFILEVKENLKEYLNSKNHKKNENVKNFKSNKLELGDSNMTLIYIIYLGLIFFYSFYLFFKWFNFGFKSLFGETIITTILPLIGIIWITFKARKLSKIYPLKRNSIDKINVHKVRFFSLILILFWLILYIPIVEYDNSRIYNETFIIDDNELNSSEFFLECDNQKIEKYSWSCKVENGTFKNYVNLSIINLAEFPSDFEVKVYYNNLNNSEKNNEILFSNIYFLNAQEQFNDFIEVSKLDEGQYNCFIKSLDTNICVKKYYVQKADVIKSIGPLSLYLGINVYD